MSFFYIAAGSYHFINPDFYFKMMPTYLPFHWGINIISGAAEILLAIALIPLQTRRFAAWGIILLLIAVFPANIQMSINAYNTQNPKFILTLFRLPFQFLFLWWAWIYTRKQSAEKI